MAERPLDRIHIVDLLARCVIGVGEEERLQKQDVEINITLYADLSDACRSDRIDDSVDYKCIKKDVIAFVEGSSFHLIEALVEGIARICLSYRRVRRATVRAEKPGALRFARTVGVEIDRFSDDRAQTRMEEEGA